MAIDPHGSERRRELLMRLFTANGDPRPDLEDEPPLSSTDVAVLFRMTARAIRLKAGKGNLPHTRTLGGGRLLYAAVEIAELYAQHCSTWGSHQNSANLGIVEAKKG